jgi:hypothetical protein
MKTRMFFPAARLAVLWIAGSGVHASPAIAFAQSGSSTPAPSGAPAAAVKDNRMQMTETITASDYKKIEGGPLLLAAYGVVWALFFGVLVYTLLRVRRVGREVSRLEGALRRSSEGSDG